MSNIPYKEALELKELGFDEKTDVWRQHGEGISGDVEGKKDYWNRKGVVYTALPTYSQAFRWFRDKYGLAAVLDYFNDCKWTYKIFEFTNTNMTPNIHQGDYSKERTYEEAEHDCLVGLIRFAKSDLGDVSSSAIRQPLGLIPKKIHDERVKVERFNEVCGAIERYYDAGLKIKIEWIEEYNGLVECGSKDYT